MRIFFLRVPSIWQTDPPPPRHTGPHNIRIYCCGWERTMSTELPFCVQQGADPLRCGDGKELAAGRTERGTSVAVIVVDTKLCCLQCYKYGSDDTCLCARALIRTVCFFSLTHARTHPRTYARKNTHTHTLMHSDFLLKRIAFTLLIHEYKSNQALVRVQ